MSPHLRTKPLLAFALALSAALCAARPAVAATATDADVTAAIAGAQQYLYDTFHDNGDGTGYWPDYDNLTGTATTVAALIESGKFSDAAYRAQIEKGIAYIKTMTHADGGIYTGTSEATYETGLSLVALGLYGQVASTDAAYRSMVQSAVNFLKSYQNIEGSTAGGDYGPNGEATSTNAIACSADAAEYYGGWTYDPATSGYDKCRLEADLSNTQFAVMGLWYGSRYLGLPIANTPWAAALLKFLKHRQDADGAFYVYSGGSYKAMAATGGGLWSLAMIGQSDAKATPGDSSTMLQRAVAWYDANYTWNYPTAYMYAIYGMSKALTANLGPAGKVGLHAWAADMKDEIVFSTHRVHADATGTAAATDYWSSGSWLDPEPRAQTAWVLMSLAFASTTTKSTEKLLAQPAVGTPEEIDNPVKGLVTLNTDGVATINAADRGKIAQALLQQGITLPLGALNFTLNDVPSGGTTVLTITPPPGALDPTNPDSFVEADGVTLKKGLRWFKIVNGSWKGMESVPVTIDLARGVIQVTLKDGGPEDSNATAGVITDPGAPGFGEPTVTPTPAAEDDSGCTIGNGSPDPTLPLLVIGSAAYLLRRRRP